MFLGRQAHGVNMLAHQVTVSIFKAPSELLEILDADCKRRLEKLKQLGGSYASVGSLQETLAGKARFPHDPMHLLGAIVEKDLTHASSSNSA
jgi:hypothetical protein